MEAFDPEKTRNRLKKYMKFQKEVAKHIGYNEIYFSLFMSGKTPVGQTFLRHCEEYIQEMENLFPNRPA